MELDKYYDVAKLYITSLVSPNKIQMLRRWINDVENEQIIWHCLLL